MSNAKHRDTSDLRAITSRLETLAFAVVAHLNLARADCDDLLGMLARIVRMIAQSDGLIRGREHFNHNIRLVAWVIKDAVFRKYVRSVIGNDNIRRWWQKYRGTYEPIRRKVKSKASFVQTRFEWKLYGLRPVPDFKEPIKKRLSEYEPNYNSFAREAYSPAFLFYGWELDGYATPQHSAHPGRRKPVREPLQSSRIKCGEPVMDPSLRWGERKKKDEATLRSRGKKGRESPDLNNRGSPNIR